MANRQGTVFQFMGLFTGQKLLIVRQLRNITKYYAMSLIATDSYERRK
jgi:hypothetical protein